MDGNMSDEVKPSEDEVNAMANRIKENAPEDVFASMFYMNLPIFKNMINNRKQMSHRKLIRLMAALIEVPINEKDYLPQTEFEKNAFLIGSKLLEAKMFMILSALQQEMDKPENQEMLKKELENEKRES